MRNYVLPSLLVATAAFFSSAYSDDLPVTVEKTPRPVSVCTGYNDAFDAHRRMMRMMDEFFDDDFNAWAPSFSRFETSSTEIRQEDKGATIAIAMPGVPKEEVSVAVEKDVLTISWKKDKSGKDQEAKFACSRSFALPKDADQANIKAVCKDGLLTVTVPFVKPAENPARTITVE